MREQRLLSRTDEIGTTNLLSSERQDDGGLLRGYVSTLYLHEHNEFSTIRDIRSTQTSATLEVRVFLTKNIRITIRKM